MTDVKEQNDNPLTVLQNLISFLDEKSITSIKDTLIGNMKMTQIFLNTSFRDQTSSVKGKIKWIISPDKVSESVTKIPPDMKKIHGMRITSTYKYPAVYTSYNETDTLIEAYSPATHSRWTILIEEFESQSCIHPDGRKFHFMGNVYTATGEADLIYETTPMRVSFRDFADGFHWFHEPMDVPRTLTFTFGDPFSTFPILDVKCNATAVKNGSNKLETTFIGTHIYLAHDPSYISGFTTTDPVADAKLIEYVNTTLFTDIVWDHTTMYELTFNEIDLTGVTLPPDLVVTITSLGRQQNIIGLELYYS